MDIGKNIEEGLMAFIPVYLDMRGNGTVFISRAGGEVVVDRTVRTVINLIAKYFRVDLKASREYYGNIVGSNNLIPLPFDGENIFIPSKVRKPMFKNDGSLGYFNIEYIERIDEEDEFGVIILCDGHRIKTLNTKATIEKHVREGELIKKICFESEKEYFYDELDKPATKWDIAMLRSEILSIKESLK